MLVSVDIQDATTVTFDSYRKEVDQSGNEILERIWRLRPCKQDRVSKWAKNGAFKDKHVLAPANYEYPELEVKSGNGTKEGSGMVYILVTHR